MCARLRELFTLIYLKLDRADLMFQHIEGFINKQADSLSLSLSSIFAKYGATSCANCRRKKEVSVYVRIPQIKYLIIDDAGVYIYLVRGYRSYLVSTRPKILPIAPISLVAAAKITRDVYEENHDKW